ncbi:MAG: hypothetical protein L3K17_01175, partial [Thermoplasmata archaeon]|nr:hypothetical protein [Thermoplasmata archaeon]
MLGAVVLMLLSNLVAFPASARAASPPQLVRPPVVAQVHSPIAGSTPVQPLAGPTIAPPTVTRSPSPSVCLAFALFDCSRPSGSAMRPAVPAASGPSSWLNLTPNPYPAVYPNPRSGEGLAYDPDTESTLMFGGSKDISDIYNDIWSVSA